MVTRNLFPEVGLEVQLHGSYLPLKALDCTLNESIWLVTSHWRGLMDGPPHSLMLPTRSIFRLKLFNLGLRRSSSGNGIEEIF